MNKQKDLNKSVKISLLVAIAVVLMYFDFPVIPIFPWLKIDLSEVPALIGGFAYGPVVGGIIVVLKVVLRFLIKGTETGGVGEIANILVGLSLVMPAAFIYNKHRSRRTAIIGMIVGTLVMEILAVFTNIYLLIPAYGIQVDLTKYVLVGLLPFNGIKATIVSIGTFILYKRLSIPIFNMDSKLGTNKKIA